MSFKRWRRERQLGRVRAGDGSALVDFRFRDFFGSRSLFFIRLHEQAKDPDTAAPDQVSAADHVYAVDVRHYAEKIARKEPSERNSWLKDIVGERLTEQILGSDEEAEEEERSQGIPAALYRDGVQVARSNLPAAFPVPGGVIEVARSSYGLTRMHYVPTPDAEAPIMLRPHRRSPEGVRARIAHHFPRLSRFIGAVAIVVLLVGLVTGLPQGLQMITEIPPIAERFGVFTSPFQFPAWLNTTLLVAGILAATERALTLKNHWLIDLDTTWSALD